MAGLEIVGMANGLFDENCYLLREAGRSEGVIIDPGAETGKFLAEADARRLRITAIWLTHAHLDHIEGVAAIKAATGAPIFLHADDLPMYSELERQGRLFGLELAPAPPPDRTLSHGQSLPLGRTAIEVRHVPGHTPGHVCFVGPGIVIGGDVLFQGSIGRTDLPGGDFDRLIHGIRTQLLTLPDETIVYPGHGPATTIGRERASNPFLAGVGPGRRG